MTLDWWDFLRILAFLFVPLLFFWVAGRIAIDIERRINR